MSRFRKKPVEVEALRVGDHPWETLAAWCGGELIRGSNSRSYRAVLIKTLEGDMTAVPGDYIIKGVQGEFYPCRSDIFQQTYEPV
jgi:hypothetical protein